MFSFRKPVFFVLPVFFAALADWAVASPANEHSTGAKSRKDSSSANFFAVPLVRKFKIEITGVAWEALKRDVRAHTHATVTVDGRVFNDVGVHLKGHGSFKPLNEKPSFTIKFDQFTPDQEYSGFNTLWLNSSSQDETFFNELICRGIYRDAGLPTPRVTHARVQLNERDLGLYVLMEPLNKRFLRQYFKDTSGNLYKPYVQDIDQPLPLESGQDASRADLKQLVAAAREPDLTLRWQRLNKVLDVEGFLNFTGVEMITAHWDGYVMNRNNYFLYHDPETDWFRIFTHDLDGGLGNGGGGLTPPQSSILTKALLEIPEARWRYRQRLPQLCSNSFNVEVLTNRVQEALARLRADARTPEETRQFQGYANNVRARILERGRNLSQQLAQEPQQLLADPRTPAASPAFWKSRKESGQPLMDRVQDNGRPALHLASDNGGGSSAAWLARVYLPPGQYAFQARVRTARVTALANDSASGVILRAAGLKSANPLKGDVPASPLELPFEVTNGDATVELGCELRAGSGEAWFDLASLKVVRR
ncbi:MAG: CotH kinase family protein [Verrucomicrobiota bacterium]